MHILDRFHNTDLHSWVLYSQLFCWQLYLIRNHWNITLFTNLITCLLRTFSSIWYQKTIWTVNHSFFMSLCHILIISDSSLDSANHIDSWIIKYKITENWKHFHCIACKTAVIFFLIIIWENECFLPISMKSFQH